MYRNRAGEYTVLAVDGDRLTIRYVTGNTITTSVAIQARIWENIQYEEQAAREEERVRLAQEARLASRKRSTRPAPAAAVEGGVAPPKTRSRFAGFVETDFQPKARGIAWPGRVSLGTALANELSRRTDRVYNKWLVPLAPEVHVARPDRYDPEAAGRNAAFFVAVNEKGAAYGFRVGKPEGRVEPSWPWSVLIASLTADAELRSTVESVMRSRGLSLDVYAMEVSYGPVAHITLAGSGFKWERETAAETTTRTMSWDDLLEYLQTVSANARTDLYMRNTLTKEDAVSAGPGIARDILTTFTALLPMYDACVAGLEGDDRSAQA
jgi:hypothetical protein